MDTVDGSNGFRCGMDGMDGMDDGGMHRLKHRDLCDNHCMALYVRRHPADRNDRKRFMT